MIPLKTQDYLRTIADHAALSILGEAAGPGQHALSDSIFTSLCDAVDAGEARGLHAVMVQTSILPEAAHVVG